MDRVNIPKSFIPQIIKNCINKKPIPIYGKGRNIRNWIHVKDNCEAILKIIMHGKINESYVIGTSFEMSNIKIAKKVCNIFDKLTNSKNSKNLIKFVKDRKGHDFRYSVNPNKIKKELGWKANIKFDQGIKELILDSLK